MSTRDTLRIESCYSVILKACGENENAKDDAAYLRDLALSRKPEGETVEACARVCDAYAKEAEENSVHEKMYAAQGCAERIRALASTEQAAPQEEHTQIPGTPVSGGHHPAGAAPLSTEGGRMCELEDCKHRVCICGHAECGHADENVQPNCSECQCNGFREPPLPADSKLAKEKLIARIEAIIAGIRKDGSVICSAQLLRDCEIALRRPAAQDGFVLVPKKSLRVISDEFHRLELAGVNLTQRADWAWGDLTQALEAAAPRGDKP